MRETLEPETSLACGGDAVLACGGDAVLACGGDAVLADDAPSTASVTEGMRKAATYYRQQVASHGGYVYHYSLDLQQRWGEGVATKDQIWVQPPGTPTVGLAFLKAYEATGDKFYLDAATDAATALVYGQLKSGGWTNCIDFDPRGSQVAEYRNGQGRGKDNSSLDDGQTSSAIRLLIHTDRAGKFQQAEIHRAAQIALDALLAAQFANGGFPQVWKGPVSPQPILKASYPEYDWRTEGRMKNYWDAYTLNDNTTGFVTDALIDAASVYQDERYRASLQRLGKFLLAAQMPEPQPGWAQQYDYAMKPIWARKFEPPAVAGDETQEVLETLLKIHAVTGDKSLLQPFPSALEWLKRSQLSDGRIARYYELKTNRPLYMNRDGDNYSLTYDDIRLPSHYGWKVSSRIAELEDGYARAKSGAAPVKTTPTDAARRVTDILGQLDEQGRWISVYQGGMLVGQPKFREGMQYLSSELFSRNLTALAEYLIQSRALP